MLACIGEQFTEGDEVCGVAVNIRNKGDRIELWTKTASNEATQVRRQLLVVWGPRRWRRSPWLRMDPWPARACFLASAPDARRHAVPHGAAQTILGRQLKQFLDIPESIKIGYGVFADKLAYQSKAKDRYTA